MVYNPLGLQFLAGLTMVEGSRPDKEQYLVLQVGGWAVGQSPAPLKESRLRKLYELENMPLFGATVVYTLLKKAKHDDLGPKPRGCSGADQTTITPRSRPKIGNWNVRTMYFAGKSAQAAR